MKQTFRMSVNPERFPKIGLFLFVFAILSSLRISFLLNVNEFITYGLISFALLIFSLSNKKYFSATDRSVIVILLFGLGLLTATRGNFNAYIGLILRVSPFVFYVLLKDEYKLKVLYSFDKILSIIVAISIIAWILMLVGVSLPHSQLSFNSYLFDNYYFFLKINDSVSSYIFPRFQCIFYEPGYFACLCAIMIYLRGYMFRKWQSVVYLTALVLTYSLSGYILFFIGLLIYVLKNKNGRIGYIFVLILLALVFYHLLMSDGNAINSMFAYRLEFEGGEMSGYNRTTDAFEAWWKTFFLNEGNWLFGDNELVNRVFAGLPEVGVEMRVFIARFGIIPLLFYLGSMIYYYGYNVSKLGLYFLLLYFIIYFRGYSIMFFTGFPMLYIAGICLLNKKNHI